MIGRGGEIRTPDILLPKQARYQTALHPEKRRNVQHLAGRESTRFAVAGSIAEIAFRRHLNSETIAPKNRGDFLCRPRFSMENT